MTCENKKLFKIIKNLPQNTYGFSASILLPRNINYPKCFEYSTLSEMNFFTISNRASPASMSAY